MNDPSILVDRSQAATAVVTLNNPAKRNAVSQQMWRDLKDTYLALGAEQNVRVVVLMGAQGHFCAGADISEFAELRDTAEKGALYEQLVDETIEAIMHIPKATVAAVSGYCMGGGCALAMACDFRVAHSSARFGIPAAKLGTLYNVMDLENLLALVGLANAKRIMYTGEPFDAAQARQMGFVDALADGALAEAVDEFIAPMADKAPLTIAGSKLTLNAVGLGTLEAKRAEISRAIDAAMESEDYHEGIRAFLEKRKPVFRGK
jgi:enoyl-CoA hydratase/carnithine racemase